jgi:hypothetical protein
MKRQRLIAFRVVVGGNGGVAGEHGKPGPGGKGGIGGEGITWYVFILGIGQLATTFADHPLKSSTQDISSGTDTV